MGIGDEVRPVRAGITVGSDDVDVVFSIIVMPIHLNNHVVNHDRVLQISCGPGGCVAHAEAALAPGHRVCGSGQTPVGGLDVYRP